MNSERPQDNETAQPPAKPQGPAETETQTTETKPNNGHKGKSWQILDLLRSIVRDNLTKILISGGTLLFGALGFVLTPAKDKALHWFYSESVQVIVIPSSNKLQQGESFNLIALLSPGSELPVAGGILTFTYDSQMFDRTKRSGSDVISVEKLDRTTTFPPQETPPLILRANHTGSGNISASFKTGYGNYFSEGKTIEVREYDSTGPPTELNWSGIWHMELGHKSGTVELLDRDQKLSGRYKLGRNEQGTISGWNDGQVFNVSLIRKNLLNSWKIKANLVKPNEPKYHKNFFQLEGDAWLRIIENNEWEIVPGTREHFYISAKRAKPEDNP